MSLGGLQYTPSVSILAYRICKILIDNLVKYNKKKRIRGTTLLGIFKESAIILNAIRLSFLSKSVTAAVFTSVRVDFGLPPFSSSSASSLPSPNREYHLKKSSVHSLIPISLLHQYWCFCRRETGLEKKNDMATLCSFPPSMTYREN